MNGQFCHDLYRLEGISFATTGASESLWDSEICGDEALYHCEMATNYLFSQLKLTNDIIVQTHSLLMRNSRDGNVPTLIGQFRTLPHEKVYCRDYQFLAPHLVSDAMDKLIRDYEKWTGDKIRRATYLMYEFLTIHPFINGNGRMARLLFAWSVMKDGLANQPTSFTSGHKRHRHHFIRALKLARRSDLTTLENIAKSSLSRRKLYEFTPNME
jgi:Fic family protein